MPILQTTRKVKRFLFTKMILTHETQRNWSTLGYPIRYDPSVSMANNFSMGFNLKSPTTYTPRRKVCQGCAVIDRYPAFFKQPSGFTVALYCTIFTRDLSACKMTALSTSFSIFRSLPLSLSLFLSLSAVFFFILLFHRPPSREHRYSSSF